MSRQRSRSPRYRTSPPRHEGAGSHSRRPPWNSDDYVESHMGLTETDERNRHPRDDAGEHWDYFKDDTLHAAKRRTPPSLLWLPTLHPHPHPEEYGRRTPPSQPREPGYAERRRLSPKQPLYRHEGGDRGRGHLRAFKNDERQHQSPQKLPRERFLPNPTAPSHHNHQQQREHAINLSRENRGRSRDSGARSTSHDHGQRDGRKDPQGPYKERRRAEPHHERSPALSNRHRREMDDALNHGYGKEEEFSSPEKPRDGFGGGDRELRGPQKAFSHREDRGARPVIVEHDHGIINSGPSQWEPRDLDLDGESRPLQKGSLHEQFRRMNRSNAREELRHHRPLHDDNVEPGRVNRANPREELGYRPLHDDNADPGRDREQSRSPVRRDRTSPTGFPDRGGSPSYGDRSPPDRGRGRMNPIRGRRMGTGPPRNHPPVHHPPQERQGPPQQPQRRENRSAGAGDFYIGSREEDPGWTEEDMEPKMPRGREHTWNSQQKPKEMTVVTEETLTIKVDMSRPVNQNSQQCFSSDRQLSLDLVNVGRQRLDFLPMLEHSGTYRESSMHTGTFAQEIITLVHQVKELYFGGYGTTLTERFAVLKEGGPPEKEHAVEEHLTLNRRFNMNKTVLPEDDEPLFPRLGDMHNDSLFSRLGDMQPPRQQQQQQMVRDPGDLRYDLDRRRQERLEGVKVTIPGGGPKQHTLGVRSDQIQNAEYDDQESNDRGEREGSSGWSAEEQLERSWSGEEPQEENWSEEVQQQERWSGQGQQQRRGRGYMGPRRGAPHRQNSPQGPRRGAPHRQNSGPQRRTHRPGNRPGQMRWQNNRNNVQTGDWTT